MSVRLHQLRTPMAVLVALCACSLAARAAWLGEPCRSPCRAGHDHLVIFDEDYYVGAARAIASQPSPAGSQYAHAPRGVDPNSEHPQLVKMLIAGSIELFGDGPFAWRLGSLLVGTIAIVGMFALARAAGAPPPVALAAAALMASDNLLLVHGRIATLDIYAVAAMIWSAVLYLRGSVVAAGVLVGIGACCKLVAPYVLLALALFEALRVLRGGSAARWRVWGRAAARIAACAAVAATVFVALLAGLDALAPPYDMSAGRRLAAGPFHHIAHMLSYAAHQTSPHGPSGIASYPWGWLVDYKPIVYLNIDPAQPATGLRGIHPAAHFLGMINPAILLAALLGLGWALWRLRRRQEALDAVPLVGIAWLAGTFLPFLALSLFWQRTSYLYYMVVVMPGLYLLASELVWRWRARRRLVGAWAVAVVLGAVALYPFTPVPWG